MSNGVGQAQVGGQVQVVIHQLPAGPARGHQEVLPRVPARSRPFTDHRHSPRAGGIARSRVRPDSHDSKPTVDSRPNLYQSYPPPSSGLTRDHTARGPEVRQPTLLRAAQKRGPQAPHHCLRPRAEGNLNRDSQIMQAVAQTSITPAPGVAEPPPQHLYSRRLYSRRWHAALRPTAHRTNPHRAHSTHEFFQGIRESITWLSEKRPDAKSWQTSRPATQ
jgi:hypothetical protein